MFGKSKGNRRDRAKGGGSAGNSSSNNKPGPGTSDYNRGFTGERSSRQGGGESLLQKQSGRPIYSDKSIRGDGGLAWDRSADSCFPVPERGSKY